MSPTASFVVFIPASLRPLEIALPYCSMYRALGSCVIIVGGPGTLINAMMWVPPTTARPLASFRSQAPAAACPTPEASPRHRCLESNPKGPAAEAKQNSSGLDGRHTSTCPLCFDGAIPRPAHGLDGRHTSTCPCCFIIKCRAVCH